MRWLRRSELEQGKTLAVIVAVGFAVGLVLMNLGKKALLYNTGLLSEYTLYDMKYSGVDSHAFFLYLLQKSIGIKRNTADICRCISADSGILSGGAFIAAVDSGILYGNLLS